MVQAVGKNHRSIQIFPLPDHTDNNSVSSLEECRIQP